MGDVCIHTSRIGESFWISMVEAMYFWVPVLSMDTDFLRWTVHDRDNSQWEILTKSKGGLCFDSLAQLMKEVQRIQKDWGWSWRANLELFMPDMIFKSYKKAYEWTDSGEYHTAELMKKYLSRNLHETWGAIVSENIRAIITKFFYI
jgi:glycosyltransferase involved in cell wall biosynthesis